MIEYCRNTVTTDLNQELLERLERETEVKWVAGGLPTRLTWDLQEHHRFLLFGWYRDKICWSRDTEGRTVSNDEFVEIVKSKLPKPKPKLKLEDVYTEPKPWTEALPANPVEDLKSFATLFDIRIDWTNYDESGDEIKPYNPILLLL